MAAPCLFVATPCYGCVLSTAFLLSLLELEAACKERGVGLALELVGNESLVQRARNLLAAKFLKHPRATHLLFIDADIGFSPEAVFRLLDSGKDIVCGTYPRKSFDWEAVDHKLKRTSDEPVHMMGLDYNLNLDARSTEVRDGFVPVLDAATGFMLITRNVLERMTERYAEELRCVNDLPGDRASPGYVAEYVALFDCMIDPQTRRYLSEDYSFNRRAQAMGIETWADLASPLCHVGNYTYEGDVRRRIQRPESRALSCASDVTSTSTPGRP